MLKFNAIRAVKIFNLIAPIGVADHAMTTRDVLVIDLKISLAGVSANHVFFTPHLMAESVKPEVERRLPFKGCVRIVTLSLWFCERSMTVRALTSRINAHRLIDQIIDGTAKL